MYTPSFFQKQHCHLLYNEEDEYILYEHIIYAHAVFLYTGMTSIRSGGVYIFDATPLVHLYTIPTNTRRIHSTSTVPVHMPPSCFNQEKRGSAEVVVVVKESLPVPVKLYCGNSY